MHFGSDIDLAVWDLPEQDYLKAVGHLLDLAEGFSIDLVEVQHAQPHIALAIEQGLAL
jgi:predicted nucleotidyltransferase